MLPTPVSRVLTALCVAALPLAAPAAAGAFPLCDSPVAGEVRAALADHDFGANLLAVVLPFLVFGGVVAVIRFAVSPAGADDGKDRA